jgi:glutathione S-transferase
MTDAVKSEADFKDAEGKVSRDANTLVLIALALGLHDKDNQYKAAAPAMVKAAQQVAVAKDFTAAKAAVAALEKAAKSSDAGELKWEKVASLPKLMKQVPLINTKMKRSLKRFAAKAKETAGDTAVLAVIAQGSMANADETKKPTEAAAWYKHCADMRDAAAAMNAAIHAGDQKVADKQMKTLTKSCDDCHAIFKPDATASN